jgi:hypothetical protein
MIKHGKHLFLEALSYAMVCLSLNEIQVPWLKKRSLLDQPIHCWICIAYFNYGMIHT